MKIVFKTLQSVDGIIQLSLDGGKNWEPYSILRIKEDGGIAIPNEQDLSLIKIKSDSTILNSLEVISSINAENSVNVSNIESISTNRQIFNKKKLNYRDSIFNIMFAMQAWNLIEENSACIINSRNILNNPDIFDGECPANIQNMFKSNVKAIGMAVIASEKENCSEYGHIFSNAITGEVIKQDNVEIIYETIEHYEDALKNNEVIQQIKDVRDDLKDLTSPYDLLDSTSIKYSHVVYRDGKCYDVTYTKENGDVNVQLNECETEKDKQFFIFFDDIITNIKRTVHPELNLNGTIINFNSTTDFVEMDINNVDKIINKYDSENNILYSLMATTKNENVPDVYRYTMFTYLNHAGPDSDLSDMPYDVWYSKEDNNNTEIYSFNFEFNDNVEDYMVFVSQLEDDDWVTNEEGEKVFYALTSTDKKGFRFTKDSSGTISSKPFDLSTINEYTAAISFIKKDGCSLFKKVVDKTPQIKIDGQDPNGKSLMIFDSEGKPSFITISRLRTELGIQQ